MVTPSASCCLTTCMNVEGDSGQLSLASCLASVRLVTCIATTSGAWQVGPEGAQSNTHGAQPIPLPASLRNHSLTKPIQSPTSPPRKSKASRRRLPTVQVRPASMGVRSSFRSLPAGHRIDG